MSRCSERYNVDADPKLISWVNIQSAPTEGVTKLKALVAKGTPKTRIAAELGISRQTLYAYLN
jgi:DNA invertase Pin-like site-specific DNA recombinase